jgi:hypothetical protein
MSFASSISPRLRKHLSARDLRRRRVPSCHSVPRETSLDYRSCLAGTHPFLTADEMSDGFKIAKAITTRTLAFPTQFEQDMKAPQEIWDLCKRMLEKDLAKRMSKIEDFNDSASQILQGYGGMTFSGVKRATAKHSSPKSP